MSEPAAPAPARAPAAGGAPAPAPPAHPGYLPLPDAAPDPGGPPHPAGVVQPDGVVQPGSVVQPGGGPHPGGAVPADGGPQPGGVPHSGGAVHPGGGVHPGWPEPNRIDRFVARWGERLPGWLAPAAVLGCVGAAAGYVLATDPTDGPADALPSCLLKYTTGLDCPGCGGTRAFFYLLRGDLGAAARHHLVFVLAVPLLLWAYAAWALRLTTGRRLPTPRFTPLAAGLALAGWLVFSVARNLPWAPFTWLYV
ncbi:hypothetical protein GCM10010123_04010 [Pilimelia anulata]|uniref:DUF2752 domain-containing protein n=1 Tax=Pilimelia anulata TaxID=53371 RepID=A0A8J3B056_9ACTN|nr:DUF2752 domain-containing protein [Pilimelia anulata]GGJ77209.1 hypothetical protein GCM10010123_04010 [Pilimelia anulata]